MLYKAKGISKKIIIAGSIIVIKNVFLDPVSYNSFLLSCAKDEDS